MGLAMVDIVGVDHPISVPKTINVRTVRDKALKYSVLIFML